MSDALKRLQARQAVAQAALFRSDGADAQRQIKERTVDLPPWIEPPFNSEPLDIIASIQCPAPSLIPPFPDWVPIFTFTMPKGWEGVITAYQHSYSDVGWVPGDGQLFFQLLAPGGAPRGLDQMAEPRGSFEAPRRLQSFIRIPQGTVCTYNVWVPSTSGLPTGAGVWVTAGIAGWYYPVSSAFNI